jgi:hypothetical protein
MALANRIKAFVASNTLIALLKNDFNMVLN